MLVFGHNGICVSSGSSAPSEAINIDSCNGAPHSIITHAHSDHATIGSGEYAMSAQTAALLEHRKKKSSKISVFPFGKRFRFPNNGNSCCDAPEVSLHNSGHIPGAAQVLVHAEREIAVTSDFKLQESLIAKPADILHCDTLVIETTFGLPEFSFPERRQIYDDMASWAKQHISRGDFIVLAGYATGKAQELTRFCNECLGVAPLVHERIHENNAACERSGVKIGKSIPLNHNLRESPVLIMPPSLVDAHLPHAISYSLGKKVVAALATGWKFSGAYSKYFPLSDHADFAQLMRYVKEAQPKHVLTTHGFAREFARRVQRTLGIPARELAGSGQSCLPEFGG